MLTVHHLGISQGERIVWLCEELGLDYKLVKHTRDPLTSPESLKSIPGNVIGQAPFIEDDGGITMSESAGVVDYIIHKHGKGRLTRRPDHPKYADYCQWLAYSNGTLQPGMINMMFVTLGGVSPDNEMYQFSQARLEKRIQWLDEHLAGNEYLAGDDLTAADIMIMYTLTTQRYWGPQLDFTPYPNVVRYLQTVAARPAYQRAMAKGDPDMQLLISAKAPEQGLFMSGGVKSDIWKKK